MKWHRVMGRPVGGDRMSHHHLARPLVLAALLVAAAFGSAGASAATTVERLAGFPRGQLIVIASDPRCLLLDVWFAVTDEQRGRGLMFVDQLDPFAGMFFGYPQPAAIAMWMKNTVLPLDMLFVDGSGRVTRVAAETTPFSESLVRSGGPVSGVLEVNARFAATWGVRTGARLLAVQPPPPAGR
jgi:uncharacterized protein